MQLKMNFNNFFSPSLFCINYRKSCLISCSARLLDHNVPDLSLENLRRLIRSSLLHLEEYTGRSRQQTEIGNLHSVATLISLPILSFFGIFFPLLPNDVFH